ncbi:MAG: SDR family oxidoreductase [Cellvibrionales bacterium TMED148]|nr:polyketide synthase [Porticoccaceae bacterium]RPG91325.1 MAG: SDR family oxidoreductase [Cellvibrionales bacterium TMED148]
MPTALVTGASDGIGTEFCYVLAERGYNLILVARRRKRLEDLKNHLTKDFGITCSAISHDLSKPGAARELFDSVSELDLTVDLLVNNAGLLQNGFFTDIDLATQENMIMVNIINLTALTHLYSKDMAERRSGHILNVASLTGIMPIPNQNVYAATKAFVLSFGRSLHNEMKAQRCNVIITTLCPGFTATKMMDNRGQGAKLAIPVAMMQSPRKVAEAGITGCLAGKDMVIPGIANRIISVVAGLLPNRFLVPALGRFYRANMKSYE